MLKAILAADFLVCSNIIGLITNTCTVATAKGSGEGAKMWN